MKHLFKALALTAAMTLGTSIALAEWTPPGPIKVMIAFKAGGGADTQARLIAEAIESELGWKMIPEQVTGKGGLNLAKALKDAPADGTVIGMAVTETFGYNMAAAAKSGMTPADFTGITTTAGFQMGLVAATSTGWKTFDDLVAAAKGGKEIRFGAMSPRLADLAYLLGKANDIEFNTISVKGGKAVLNGVNAGDMDVGFMAGIQSKGVAAGDLVNLASGLSTPLMQTPDAPLLKDLGVPFNSDGQFVFVGPAGMDSEARSALAEAIAAVASDTESKAGQIILKALGGAVIIQGDELDSQLQAGFDSSAELLKAASE